MVGNKSDGTDMDKFDRDRLTVDRGRRKTVQLDPTQREIVVDIIRRRVSRAIKSGHWPSGDRADLEQQLVLATMPRLGGYCRSRGLFHAFAAVVVRTALANLLRKHRAARRGHYRKHSAIDDSNEAFGRVDQEFGRADARLELAEIRLLLGTADQHLLDQLLEHSCADIARQRGVPASTVRAQFGALKKRVLKRIRQPKFDD